MDSEEIIEMMGVILLVTTTLLATGIIKKRRNRRFKIRPMNRNRREISVYKNIIQYAELNDREQFFKYTRMSPEMFNYVLSLIKSFIQRSPRIDSICPGQRLAMTLHYLAEGCSFQEIAFNNFIGVTTSSLIITETCEVLWKVLSPIVLPSPTENTFRKASDGFFFRWNMPNCIGAIDGKLVNIQSPNYSGSDYFSYKKSFSIILMAVCDSSYRFQWVNVGAPGSNNDASVFRESMFGQLLLQKKLPIPSKKNLPGTNLSLPHFLVADQAFPLHENIMRPYPGNYLGESKNIFNYRLSRARRTIENTFGILAQRWRRLRSPIIARPETCEKIILATIVLHNLLHKGEEDLPIEERRYCPTGFVDALDKDGNIKDGAWRTMPGNLNSIGRIGANNAGKDIFENRDYLMEYFLSAVGALPGQWNQVHQGGVPSDFSIER